ncbi:hypothetical protein ACFL20_11245 [Spirochaetota bacterium]
MLKLRTVKALFVLVAVVLIIAPASATITSDSGLGLYEKPWMVDGLHSMIYQNPAYLSKNKNRMFYERLGFDNNGTNMGGFIWNPISSFNIGVLLGHRVNNSIWNSKGDGSFFHVGSGGTAYQPGSLDNATLSENNSSLELRDPSGGDDLRQQIKQQDVAIVASYDLGNMAFGFSFSYASAWKSDNYNSLTRDDKYTLSSSQYNILLGGIIDLGNTMILDFDVLYTYYDLENTYKADDGGTGLEMTYEGDNAMDVKLGVGFNMNISNLQRLHFRVAYGFMNRSAKGTYNNNEIDIANDNYKRIGNEIIFGISDEFRFSNNMMAFIGGHLNFTMFSYEYSGEIVEGTITPPDAYKADIKSVSIPLVIGLQGNLSKNWTARCAVSHIIYDMYISDITVGSNKGTINDNLSHDTEFTVGVSYKLGYFKFDWVLNVGIFVEGPYFISGKTPASIGGGESSTPVSGAFAVSFVFDSLLSKQGQ